MNKETLIRSVAFRLGNVKGMDTIIGAEIDASIIRLENENFHPWFLLSENNVYKAVIGEGRIPVPGNFLAEYEDSSLYVQNSAGYWLPLQKTTAGQARASETSSTGLPVYYALTNTYFRIFPVPDKEYNLELIFYRRSASLSVQVNPWYLEAADLVVFETASTIFLARQDKRWMEMRQLAQQQKMMLQSRHTEREETNRQIVMGGDY